MFLPSCVLSSRPDLSRNGLEIGGADWKNLLDEQLLFLVVEQLLLLVVDQLSNPILFSIRASMRSLAEVEVTCILFRIRLLQFSV